MKAVDPPGRGSSSSVLLEFLLFDMLRPPAVEDGVSSFLGANALFRLISVLVDCELP